jgi:serine O-acetyltransferase
MERTTKPASDPGFWAILKEDKRTNGSVMRPGFQAMLMYRLGRWAVGGSRRRRPALWLAIPMRLFVRNFYGIEMYWSANIGRRFKIAHQGAIVIHALSTIGDDCMVTHGSTIGVADTWDSGPVLGDNVNIGAGAMILGKVRVGNNVQIGPNSVVTTDIPDNSTVFPPASRVVSWG